MAILTKQAMSARDIISKSLEKPFRSESLVC
jgi:hypothetical protein